MDNDYCVLWCDLCECCVPYNEELKGWYCGSSECGGECTWCELDMVKREIKEVLE